MNPERNPPLTPTSTQPLDDGSGEGDCGSRCFWLAAAGIFVVWLLLTGSLAGDEMALGLAVALCTAFISAPHLALLGGLLLSPSLPWQVLRYLGVFLWALVEANLDMARRVVSPRLPISPAMVEVRTGLRSALGRLLLANSITLTPGTLSVDVLDDRLQVHWIDATPGTDLEVATRAIAERFERHLRGFVA